jgi:hypothetical protein
LISPTPTAGVTSAWQFKDPLKVDKNTLLLSNNACTPQLDRSQRTSLS